MGVDLEKIKRLREAKGWSLADAAAAIGFKSRQQWYQIETGERANLTVDTLEKVAKVLGVKAKDLLK